MVLVLSTKRYEQGTDPVVECLVRDHVPFLRLSIEQLIGGEASVIVDFSRSDILVKGKSLRKEVKVIWYRRFLPQPIKGLDMASELYHRLQVDLKEEGREILKLFFEIMKDRRWLPSFRSAEFNKLLMLLKAPEHGIRVPLSRMCSTKEAVLSFLEEAGELITKPVYRNVFYPRGESVHVSFTRKLYSDDFERMPDRFYLSLFQQYIRADFEVRAFYLDGDFYSLAQLPLHGAKAGERNADIKLLRKEKALGYVRYSLAERDRDNLRRFMRSMDLNIGSMDLLVYEEELYLVDVNPVGQYLFESQVGNMHLDRIIAQWLMDHDK